MTQPLQFAVAGSRLDGDGGVTEAVDLTVVNKVISQPARTPSRPEVLPPIVHSIRPMRDPLDMTQDVSQENSLRNLGPTLLDDDMHSTIQIQKSRNSYDRLRKRILQLYRTMNIQAPRCIEE
eukprot:COSAG02_NODE_8802_length_2439_cov_1.494444_2_plen_122_part_00